LLDAGVRKNLVYGMSLELVDRMADRLGRSLPVKRLVLPGWMRSGWASVAAYLALQWLVAGASIHRIPHSASIMLVLLTGLAFLCGLLFLEPRTFCKALCPASALLSVYSRQAQSDLIFTLPTPAVPALLGPAYVPPIGIRSAAEVVRRGFVPLRGMPVMIARFAWNA